MRWEIINNEPKVGEIRFRTRFAFFPTQVVSKLTNTDHMIWLELYLEEQEYVKQYELGWEKFIGWKTVARTIHI
jgi:hypothetical protein